MAKRQLTRKEAELSINRVNAITHFLTTVCVVGIRCTAFVLVARYCAIAVESLSGKETFADIGLNVLGDIKLERGALYVFGFVCLAYGLGERKLRQKRVAELSDRTAELEKMIDPERSSSGLMRSGTTRNEDKI